MDNSIAKPRNNNIINTFVKHRFIYIMLIPVLLYYVVFHYIPMGGVVIAFKHYTIGRSILNSPWVGLNNFYDFFNSYYFLRLIRNTLSINVYGLIFGFPAPIIFALLLNEIKNASFKRVIQTGTYIPHFISIVIASGIILDFFSTNGIVNNILKSIGIRQITFMTTPEWFYPIYVGSDIWQHLGWNSIIYMAALSAVDPERYDAATVDGAGRWKQLLHVTLPGIAPTIIILLILQMGSMMSVGFEKIMLLYNSSIYESADVISTFVYRKGLLELNYSYSTAVGLFNSLVNFSLLIIANALSRRFSENSLW